MIALNTQISYFIIAFSIYLLGKSFVFFHQTSLYLLLFDVFIGVSLLCSHVPRVLPVSFRAMYVMRKAETISFFLSLIMLGAMFVH